MKLIYRRAGKPRFTGGCHRPPAPRGGAYYLPGHRCWRSSRPMRSSWVAPVEERGGSPQGANSRCRAAAQAGPRRGHLQGTTGNHRDGSVRHTGQTHPLAPATFKRLSQSQMLPQTLVPILRAFCRESESAPHPAGQKDGQRSFKLPRERQIFMTRCQNVTSSRAGSRKSNRFTKRTLSITTREHATHFIPQLRDTRFLRHITSFHVDVAQTTRYV